MTILDVYVNFTCPHICFEQAIEAMGSLPMSRAMELFKEVEEKAVPLKNILRKGEGFQPPAGSR